MYIAGKRNNNAQQQQKNIIIIIKKPVMIVVAYKLLARSKWFEFYISLVLAWFLFNI